MDSLSKAVTKEFAERHIEVDPLFPRILVRLLPKEQMTTGGIALTDYQQNKPVHEGVVLRVYKPFWQIVRLAEDWLKVRSRKVEEDENGKVKKIWQEAEVQPGDHILFPHMAPGITPVWPLDGGIGQYRLVPEGQIFGKLEYHKKDILGELADFIFENDLQDANINLIKDRIKESRFLEKFTIIRKDLTSKTLSGV